MREKYLLNFILLLKSVINYIWKKNKKNKKNYYKYFNNYF